MYEDTVNVGLAEGYLGSVTECHSVSVSQCVTVSQCHSVTVSQNVILIEN